MNPTKSFISKDTSRGGVFYLYYFDSEGKRQRKSLKTIDRKKAESELLKFNQVQEETRLQKLLEESKKYTLRKFSSDILAYIKLNHSFGTHRLYETTLKYLQDFLNPEKELSEISIQDIELFKGQRLRFVKPTTVNSYLRKIKASFNHAIKLGLVKTNPASNISFLREFQNEKKVFSDRQLENLISAINNNMVRHFVLFGAYTGCRLSEILNVEWADIDFKDKTIIIKNKDNFKTKTGKIRRLPISEKLYVILSKMYYEGKEGYVFLNELNLPFTKDAITKRFKIYLSKANLPSFFHFHCLRHTFITNLIKKGVSIYLVKELAGHSDIKTTIGYTHIVTEDLRQAVNIL